jgi:hypothetical protein
MNTLRIPSGRRSGRHRLQANDDLLAELLLWLSPADRAAVERCAARLRDVLPRTTSLAENVVLVMYGGGKDSSFVVAFTRAVQLTLRAWHGSTFTLRVASNFQPGMAFGVTANINRVYRALGMFQDPQVELIAVVDKDWLPYRPGFEMPASLLARYRLSILMNGHHTGASNRATFCNACNLSMVQSFAVALGAGGPADVIITGDSEPERRSYYTAVRRVARDLGLPRPSAGGFKGFVQQLASTADAYATHVYGPQAGNGPVERIDAERIPGEPAFFSLFEDTNYDAGSHWGLLCGFLGFRFDSLAFSFSETDCANPALMAHLRGLRAEHLWGRPYEEGVAEYRDYALELMRKKDFPEVLVQRMAARYGSASAIGKMRRQAADYALQVLDLSETQLVCMIYAPFLDGARNLARYLAAEQPAGRRSEADIRAALAGGDAKPEIAALLEEWSGLELGSLRQLYRSALSDNSGGQTTFIGPIRVLFRRDPHQAALVTRYRPDGAPVVEIESGR